MEKWLHCSNNIEMKSEIIGEVKSKMLAAKKRYLKNAEKLWRRRKSIWWRRSRRAENGWRKLVARLRRSVKTTKAAAAAEALRSEARSTK